ncbi:gamma carbonic anhydrase family protein [Vulgatibacter incomptus]|uniref:Carbonic anhydrase, family 3 n=1 Tax=Vulgatibacter incomptus TaxID=1391653 RepID=A0A0K1PBH0_9BACT|nr:gamma carbonic anhydrase family protein [Vulgatibacter incomptus]AKU90842.1 carbonic anhydrase, family 3 [Vulgatibacter incomptus]
MIRPCPFTHTEPSIDETAYVDVSAHVIGRVRIGARSSIWPGVVVRGDVHTIEIGDDTNVQDLSCLHVLKDRFSLTLGSRVSVGHGVMLHGCTIGDGSLIGMRATIMDDARIGANCLVAAGALVTPGFEAPPGSLVMGSPAKVKRELDASELELLDRTWRNYVDYSRAYIAKFGRGF